MEVSDIITFATGFIILLIFMLPTFIIPSFTGNKPIKFNKFQYSVFRHFVPVGAACLTFSLSGMLDLNFKAGWLSIKATASFPVLVLYYIKNPVRDFKKKT